MPSCLHRKSYDNASTQPGQETLSGNSYVLLAEVTVSIWGLFCIPDREGTQAVGESDPDGGDTGQEDLLSFLTKTGFL